MSLNHIKADTDSSSFQLQYISSPSVVHSSMFTHKNLIAVCVAVAANEQKNEPKDNSSWSHFIIISFEAFINKILIIPLHISWH